MLFSCGCLFWPVLRPGQHLPDPRPHGLVSRPNKDLRSTSEAGSYMASCQNLLKDFVDYRVRYEQQNPCFTEADGPTNRLGIYLSEH